MTVKTNRIALSTVLIILTFSLPLSSFQTWNFSALITSQGRIIAIDSEQYLTSYTVYVVSGTYYGKNANGLNEFNGTDAATVIQDTIDNGYSVFITAGTYPISRDIIVKSDLEVYGCGVTTKLVAATDSIAIFNTTSTISIANFTLRDMWLQGIGGADSINIRLMNTNYSTLSNLRVTNAGRHGIYLQTNCYHNMIIGNTVINNGWSGICLSGGSLPNTVEYNIVKGNIASGNGWHGIQLGERSNYNVVADNIAKNNGASAPGDGAGIMLGAATQNSITGNMLYDNINAGIWVEDNSGFNVLSGNTIYSEGQGIYLYGVSNNTIIGNTIQGNGVGVNSDGILVYHPSIASLNNVFEANIIYNCGRDGLLIYGTNDNNIVSNNRVMGNVEWGIRDLGDRSIFIGNYVTGNSVGGIKTVGVNTKVNLCYNGTNWIP